MAKTKLHFLCSACGSVQPKWMGKCPDCSAWDTLQEYREPTEDTRRPVTDEVGGRSEPAEAESVAALPNRKITRMVSGIGEFDRILGGGIVPGSVTLVGGEPGIGKSTLLLQAAAALAGKGHGVLYATSEESADQTRLRAERLNVKPTTKELKVLAEANLERIASQVRKHKPAVVVLDSIQMAYKPDLPAAPGSVTQLREGTMMLTTLAKTSGTAVLLVGHVTKQGVLAGPKLLEHVVDTVVYFEGDRYHAHRIVRCIKNRFGSTHEVGLFRMASAGLEEVTDPSNLFTEHHGGAPPSGSILTAALSGNRVLLLEVQALTASSVIGAARRKVSGVSADRVAMIIAVLEKRAELRLAAEDVFVNIAGGVKIPEPALDLPIALAIASAHANRPLPAGTLALGELGLGGEVRQISQLDQRLREAARLGITHAIVPPMGGEGSGGSGEGGVPKLKGMSVLEVRKLQQALSAL